MVAAFPMRLSSSTSRERVSEMVEPRYTKVHEMFKDWFTLAAPSEYPLLSMGLNFVLLGPSWIFHH